MPNVANYREQGGDRTVIGASLDVVSGGDFDVEAGGAFKLAGVTVSASAADLNSSASQVASITVVAANGAADTVDVVVTALDADGVAIANPLMLFIWLSDASTGLSGSAHTHSTGPAFTVGEESEEKITNDSWLALTTAAGTATLRLVDTANEDVTINASSGAIFGQDTTVAGDWSA